MKKVTFILITLVGFILVGCDGQPNTSTWPLQQPENAYEIDAWGTNPDLLEFTPKGNEDYFCVLAVSGMDELRTMFCMPKKGVSPN